MIIRTAGGSNGYSTPRQRVVIEMAWDEAIEFGEYCESMVGSDGFSKDFRRVAELGREIMPCQHDTDDCTCPRIKIVMVPR